MKRLFFLFISLLPVTVTLQQQTATPARFSVAELPPGVWLGVLELENGSVFTSRFITLPH